MHPNKKSNVSIACIHCKKAHLACDHQRPCRRCVSTGKADTCVDLKHKKRGRPPLNKRSFSTSSDIPSLMGDNDSDSSFSLSSTKSLVSPPSPTNTSETSSAQSTDDYEMNNGKFQSAYSSKRVEKLAHIFSSIGSGYERSSDAHRQLVLTGGSDSGAAGRISSQRPSNEIFCEMDRLTLKNISPDNVIGLHQQDLCLNISLYDLVHDFDRYRLRAFHFDLIRSLQMKNEFKNSLVVHLRSRTHTHKLCELNFTGSHSEVASSGLLKMSLFNYQHPLLLKNSTQPEKYSLNLMSFQPLNKQFIH